MLFPPPASCFTCGHAVVQYVVHAVAVFELGFFVFSFFDQLQYGSTVTDATVGANNTAAALVQAQRDTYLAAFSVFTLGCVTGVDNGPGPGARVSVEACMTRAGWPSRLRDRLLRCYFSELYARYRLQLSHNALKQQVR